MGRITDYRELAQKLKPYIAPWIVAQGNSQAASSAVSGMSAHALNGAYHTGTLAQSQAPWAVTDDEFAVHTGNPDAHHARATATTPLVVTGQDVSLSLGHGVETFSNALRAKLPTNSGLVRDSTGIYLSPSTVGAATTNSVTASGHTHTVDASSNPGANAKILRTAADGSITLESVTVNQSFYAAATAFRVINHTHDYPHTHVVVNPGISWTLDEQFGVDIDDNLLVRGYIVGKHALQLPGAKLIAHYDGPQPYETNFKGEANGHMGQVATLSGGVIFRPGQFGKALQAAGATTNLVTNPSFETNTTGWSALSAFPNTFTRTAARTYYGSYSIGAAFNGTAVAGFATTFSVTSGTQYTVSAYLYCEARAAGTFSFDVVHPNGTETDIVSFTAATGAWARYSASFTPATSGTATIRFFTDNSFNGTVYVDGVQAEVGARSPYCDGSLGDGHSWSGTAHNSTSSRAVVSIYYPTAGNVQSGVGTVMAWVSPVILSASPQTVFRFDGTTAGQVFLRLYNSGKPEGRWGTTTISASSAITANAWAHLAMSYDGTTLRLYVNGVESTSGATSGFSGMPTSMYVGMSSGGEYFSGCLDELVILDRAASADEIRAVYESNAPVFAETSTWHWRSGRNRVWADAEGLWMLGASGSAVIGAYAGDDANPSATKSWGGATMAEGDVVIGHNQSGSAAMVWDRSAGKFQFVGNGSATVQAEIATDGQISAGNGAIKLGRYGARLLTGTARYSYLNATDGSRIMWLNSEIFETLEEAYTYLGTNFTRNCLVMRTVGDSGPQTAHTEIGAHNEGTGYSAYMVFESGTHIENYTPTFSIGTLAYLSADMFHIDTNRVRVTGNAGMQIYQGSTTNAQPVLLLSQSDVSEEMIEFAGTVAAGNTINTDALGSYYGRVRVSVNGTFKWLALYN